MRRLLSLALALVLAVPAAAAADASRATLAPAQGAKFPDRSWLLSLPAERSLTAEDLTVTENGVPVHDLEVFSASGSGTFGAVLAIDTSPSMRSRDAIGGAMNAARAFAARRPPSHRLGVVFFSGGNRLALAPTTETSRIDPVLQARPALTEGTRIYDAVGAAFDALKAAGISSGSVVLLSDGCRLRQGQCLGVDAGSRLDHAATVALARKFKTRVFTVGLRSKSYDGAPLKRLAEETGGVYSEAASPRALAAVFDSLGSRLAGEYVLAYRSPSRLGSDVEVAVEAAGLSGATARYRAPSLEPVASGVVRDPDSWWTSAGALALLVASIVLLTGAAAFVLLRPERVTAAERIIPFVSPVERGPGREARRSVVLEGAERSLSRVRWWPRFVELIDVGNVAASPLQILFGSLAGMVFSGWFFGIFLHRPLVAILLLVAIPLLARYLILRKASRQRRRFEEQLPDNLQVVASAMRAGHSFAGALGVSVDDAAEPAKRELRRVVNDERLGVPIEEALDHAARRMENRELEHVALVSQLQRDVGGNTAEVLDRLNETMRANADVRRLVRTLTAQGRLGGTIVSLMPVAVVFFINLLNPNYMDPLLDSPIGRIVLGMGVLMMASGWLVIRRIVDIKV